MVGALAITAGRKWRPTIWKDELKWECSGMACPKNADLPRAISHFCKKFWCRSSKTQSYKL